MQRYGTALGAECARSVLARIILLFCIGWILRMDGPVVLGAPVIERNDANELKHNEIGNDASIQHNLANSLESFGGNVITTPASPPGAGMNHDRDKLETDSDGKKAESSGTPPEIMLPDNILQAMQQAGNNSISPYNNGSAIIQHDGVEDDNNGHHHVLVEMEYEPNVILRCAAKGNPKPNVTFEYEDGHFSHYVTSNSMTHGYNMVQSDKENHTLDETAWVDLKLPKLNNAFYGTLRCRANNVHGNVTWEVKLLHNANSSALMKVVRCALAVVFLLVAVLLVKGISWADKKRHEKLYERLPPQDMEIINKFKKGLEPPPPSPCSSIIVQDSAAKSLLEGATSCVKGIEETVSGSGEDGEQRKTSAMKGGYRPVKQGSSSPELQQRYVESRRGGTSTPSTCSSSYLDTVNSWTNYVPYDDKLEISSRHFKVDFLKIIEKGCYGTIYAGKIRNDLTMEWSSVAVKHGSVDEDEDNNFMLECILTELKLLASLPKQHDNIVNLKGAYTKKLHNRRAFLFVDYCEHGTLASFIDLNRGFFQEMLRKSEEPSSSRQSYTGSGIPASGKESENRDEVPSSSNATTNSLHAQISLKTLFAWAWQIADGMNFLHKNRVIHGNLATSNIYVGSNLKVKVGNIGYPPMDEVADSVGDKNWLTVPHYCYEQLTNRTDIWDFGRVIWEIFSLRGQKCPDNETIANFMHNNGNDNNSAKDDDDDDDEEGLDIPQYASEEIFEVMLCCWNENATLSPEFDFFVKSFKKLYRELLIKGYEQDKSQHE